MVSIAIVEDGDKEAAALTRCLERYEKENCARFSYVRFSDAMSFLEYREAVDIVFMDIMLPNISGIEAARQLRKFNDTTIIIFVTNMAQFAIQSYEVDAFDYVLKPVTYERVTKKLDKALAMISAHTDKVLVISQPNGFAQIPSESVYYIEVRGHKLSYHTDKGKLTEHGSLGELENTLRDMNFLRCNSCYLVNPKYISSVTGMRVKMVNGDELKISQPKRKSFIDSLTRWMRQSK